ncbi:adenosylcobinamide-GDP ribazoletransferase [Xanthobacter dioxanivorans]|uniref:Adenosylcobinamide-GDP ribazoletransferase n=1 Tax=Xanthobacter dioxanivorans TaxID=2528964 RepID=A0A974PL71_9HYPH|nr:adenosylcobinamide-GDP ribazoletransferase [Xanthobacter dioxanivorans]QRG05579.1 adenosylcobinamide-GDP ribazoletransferase [Xanthobacter dioxanivorans]
MPTHRIAKDLAAALRFYSRIPLPAGGHPAEAHAAPDLDRIAYAIPLAGVVIGLVGGVVLVAAVALKLPAFLAAALAVTALVLATGAFHEDGLADTADGLGGGRDRAQKLAIMRDSRIGTYGTAALGLSLLLRIGALEALVTASGPLRTALTLVAASAVSRAAGILLLLALPPARADGSGAAFGQPSAEAALSCGLVAALVAAVVLVPSFGIGAAFAGLVGPLLALFFMVRLSGRLIGGQTGDVAGATQQVAEIVFLIGVLIFRGR